MKYIQIELSDKELEVMHDAITCRIATVREVCNNNISKGKYGNCFEVYITLSELLKKIHRHQGYNY